MSENPRIRPEPAMSLPARIALLLALTLLAGPALAQSGPWQGGEIIIYNHNNQNRQLLRINPDTGHGAARHGRRGTARTGLHE